MGQQTAISWTDATWNPWRGCHKVSAGCRNCYMFRDQKRYGLDPNFVVRSKSTFKDPLKWTEPRKIFTCSWSDWFIEEADIWRDEAWDIIRQTPQHTYQILTKRPERIAQCLPDDWGNGYPNVWLGVTAENQEQADKRILPLIRIPARVHWLSVEPLLGPITLSDSYPCGYYCDESVGHVDHHWYTLQGVTTNGDIEWVIVGGESGPGYRPMLDEWALSLRDQCEAAGVPYFFKQHSGMKPGTEPTLRGVEYHEMP